MKSRLDDLPRYSSRSCLMEATTYNRVRLGLMRLGNPLRFALPGLRTLEVIIDKDSWICVDSGLNDYPILAWVEFKHAERNSLHKPIPCSVYTYHAHAELIEPQVLAKIEAVLGHRLRKAADG